MNRGTNRGSTTRRARVPLRGSLSRGLAPLLVLVAVAWLLPAIPALGTPPTAEVRSVTLTSWTSVGDRAAANASSGSAPPATAGWAVSPVLDPGDAVLVGAGWGGDLDVEVEVRASRDDAWGGWQRLILDPDHAPDPGTPEAARQDATLSDPLWIGPSDALQVRRRGPTPPSFELRLVDMVGGDGLGYVPRPAIGAPASAATVQPSIISRAEWGADESRRRYTPLYASDVRFAVVHHTAGSNDYTRDEADDVIRSIYAYHLSKGWDDIAYNFLVDRFGRVYEGRSGGITEPVMGAHAAGWNGGSTGVSVMGNFNVVEPPQAVVDSLDRLLAWKLDLHHVDPNGQTDEIAGGGSSNRYDRGDRVTLPSIIGHRDTNNTSCPGDNLYDWVAGRDGATSLASRIDQIGLPKAYDRLPPSKEQPQIGIRPQIDVSFSEPLDWELTIDDEEGELVRSTGGVDESSVALEWDLRDGNGSDAELVDPGTYVMEVNAVNGDGDPVTPIRTEFTVTPPAERIRGATRVETAVEMSRWAFDSAQRVVIASSEAFPDALVAGPLAGSLSSPILLVPSTGLPDVVAEEIARLHSDHAWIIGGTARIPEFVEDQLTDAGIQRITRLSGANRYETAAAVADAVITREHPAEAFLALGEHPDPTRAFPDALAAGAFGATFQAPVLLAAPTNLPQATAEVLVSRDWPDGITVFGGSSAVPDDVLAVAENEAGAVASRLAGTDRYDTARLAVEEQIRRWEEWVDEHGPSPYADPTGTEVVLASGRNWPDALGAGAAAAERGALFLLVDDTDLDESAATQEWLTDHTYDLAHAVIAGGTAAVADAVVERIESIAVADGWHREDPSPWQDDPHGDDGLDIQLPLPLPSSSPSPTATSTVSPSPDASPSPDVSPSPDASPSPDTSPSPGASPSPDTSASPGASPSPDASPSPAASPTPTPAPDP